MCKTSEESSQYFLLKNRDIKIPKEIIYFTVQCNDVSQMLTLNSLAFIFCNLILYNLKKKLGCYFVVLNLI